MANVVNINGINELDLTLPGSTSVSTSAGVTSITNTPTYLKLSIVSVSANYSIQAIDYQIICTANSFTVTLPTVVGANGTVYSIKNKGTGVITVATTSSQTIDGQLTQTLSQWDNLVVVSDGSGWNII